MRPLGLVLLWLAGCAEPAAPGGAGPTVEIPLTAVFPSQEYVGPSGLDLPAAAFANTATPLPLDRLNGRQGFSLVQTTVVDLGVDLDPASLPAPGVPGGSVQLWDLTVGEELLALVELDAYPQDDEPPTLLVRPLAPFASGHEIAVVLTTAVQTADGPLARPSWLDPAAAAPVGRWLDSGTRLQGLLDRLSVLPIEGEIAVATSFPVVAQPAAIPAFDSPDFAAALDAMRAPPALTWDEIEVASEPGELGANIWIRARGTLTAPGWLDSEGLLAMDGGVLVQQDDWEADVTVLVPESLRDAGPAPLWQFGHGIFSSPALYLSDEADNSGVIQLAHEAGVVMIATSWPGLTTADAGIAFGVSGDFGRFPFLTERLQQAVSNQGALAWALCNPTGPFVDDDLLEGIVDWDQVASGGLRWYGISLGGIGGAVVLAHNPPIDHAVLHVGGSAWSTMLERSDTWALFEPQFTGSVPSAAERQRLIALSQLFWDPVDPATYAADLRGRSLLFQQALGDERVPNRTTELLLRGANPVVLSPVDAVPQGFSAEVDPSLPALVIQDPELPLPPDLNRPPDETGAHEAPRLWATHRQQVRAFLSADSPGVVVHPCGSDPCTASNAE